MRWFIAPVLVLALAAPAAAKQRPTGGYVCGENGTVYQIAPVK